MANLSVLVIDDDDMVRRAIVRGLRRRYEVTELRDAETALVLIHGGQRFDAILCDLNLTGMSGSDFFLNLEANNDEQAARVIILTGNIGAVGAADFGENGPLLLEKPVSIAKLEGLIRDLADGAARAA
ncbi:MAG TPA: response regulator [Labilithrix sp.]|nr:response regulator [Labilithrix sp.]